MINFISYIFLLFLLVMVCREAGIWTSLSLFVVFVITGVLITTVARLIRKVDDLELKLIAALLDQRGRP